jgi:hypothetical protein
MRLRAAFLVFAAASLGAPVAGAGAQNPGDTAAFPPVPSSKPVLRLAADPADSGFGDWRHRPLPRHDKTPAAWTMRAGDWDFLLATPRAMDAMDTSKIIDTTLANCRGPLNISPADSAHIADAKPWAPFDSLVEDRPVLVISIMPVLRNFTECGFKNLGRPAMIRRGLRFVTDFTYDASRDPVSAVLLSRQRIMRPAELARAPVMVMSRGGIPAHQTDQLRLYIPYDAIAPGPNGDMPRTELLIWTKAGGEPDHIPLPNNIMRAVWWDYLRWRGARLVTRDRATRASLETSRRTLVHVPTPSDPGLKTALQEQKEGRDAESTTLTLERLTEPKLSTNDRRIALMSLASTFQTDDDRAAASLVADELTSMDPCALSGSDAPAAAMSDEAYAGLRSAGALLDHTRPGVRCTAMRPGAAFLRGIILPGYGQYSTWSHLIGLSTGVLTVAGALTAYGFVTSADHWYARYQTNLSGYAPRYFTTAVSQRNNASTVAIATGVLWLGSAIEAEWQERVHANRLAAIHDFWFKPIMTGTQPGKPFVIALGAGVGVGFR